ncbi:hypothetical protein LSAT2_022396, partial [Lamellibrachia satsuma]
AVYCAAIASLKTLDGASTATTHFTQMSIYIIIYSQSAGTRTIIYLGIFMLLATDVERRWT